MSRVRLCKHGQINALLVRVPTALAITSAAEVLLYRATNLEHFYLVVYASPEKSRPRILFPFTPSSGSSFNRGCAHFLLSKSEEGRGV